MEGQGAQAQKVANSSLVNTPSSEYVIIFRDDSNSDYWAKLPDGSVEPLNSSVGSGDWKYNGNAVPSEKSIGTTNNFDFPVIVNNVERARFYVNGRFGIGDSTGTIGNLAIGYGAGIITDVNNHNVGIGYFALNAVSATGKDNTALGFQALKSNTTGVDNTAIGTNAMRDNTTGSFNTAIGRETFMVNTTGQHNLACGGHALLGSITGDFNTAVGVNAIKLMSGADNNTAVGEECMAAGVTPSPNNTAVGRSALYNINGGIGQNVCMGLNVMFENLVGAENVAIGPNGLRNSLGNQNVAIGHSSGFTQTTSSRNVFLGYQSGYYETGNDKYMIDNRQRASEADARLKALIYGVFDTATANQVLFLNAAKINVQYLPTGNAGLVTGDLYVDTAANILANADLVVGRKV